MTSRIETFSAASYIFGVVVKSAEAGARTFSTRAAARILAVSPDRIRYWVRHRLVNPATRRGRRYRFAFKDLLVMRMAKELLPGRGHLEPFQRCVEKLRSFVEPARPFTALRLENDDGRILVRDGTVVFEAESGQLVLQFGHPALPGKLDDRFGPARVQARFEEARQLAESDPLRALKLYSDLLGREPRNFDLHMRMATMLENNGDLAGAARHLLGAAVLVPTNAEVHLRLGLIYRNRGEHDNAVQSFLRAAQCDPLSVEAHRNLAELYEKLGRKCDSLRHLSTLHRLSRDN